MENIHALIIDDNPTDIDILCNLLHRLGVSYDVLADSRAIHTMLETTPRPTLIFLDLEMPAVNGYEVLQEIRATHDFNAVPVIAYTANSAEMSNARAAGFHSFLGKPLRSGEFAGQLERIVNGDSVWEVR